MPARRTPLQWFQTKYQVQADGCWIWQRSVREEYGRTRRRGKNVAAHRYSWELHRGPIPTGAFVLHRCDVPLCVNPDHLFLGGHAVGENHSRAKLDWIAVRGIRHAFAALGTGIKPMARAYGVTPAQIRRIVRGQHWKESASPNPEPHGKLNTEDA